MTLNEIEASIVSRMTPEQRADDERGRVIVDYYMSMACDTRLPVSVRHHARCRLRDFAMRLPGQTVADIDGKADQ